jgi:hypothetical protein
MVIATDAWSSAQSSIGPAILFDQQLNSLMPVRLSHLISIQNAIVYSCVCNLDYAPRACLHRRLHRLIFQRANNACKNV